MPQEKVFKAADESPFFHLLLLPMIGKATAEQSLNSTNVQKFMQRNDLEFDLVINEEFSQESLSMFAYKYKAPLITISKYEILFSNLLLNKY